jgi:hypothetical protein
MTTRWKWRRQEFVEDRDRRGGGGKGSITPLRPKKLPGFALKEMF